MVLSAWPVVEGSQSNPYSTVMQWDSYKEVDWKGQSFGMKSREFKAIEELPSLYNENFVLALGSSSAPKSKLQKAGWLLEDPLVITKDHRSYQAFIQRSKGEFTVAKHGYVASKSGWFSERSAAYLASGRPVITQETGFTSALRTGKGLYAFSDLEQALDALSQINNDYEEACKSARQLAAENFDHAEVLSHLLNQL
jgi:hypothetical protein